MLDLGRSSQLLQVLFLLQDIDFPLLLWRALVLVRSSRLPQAPLPGQRISSWDFVACISLDEVFPAAADPF